MSIFWTPSQISVASDAQSVKLLTQIKVTCLKLLLRSKDFRFTCLQQCHISPQEHAKASIPALLKSHDLLEQRDKDIRVRACLCCIRNFPAE